MNIVLIVALGLLFIGFETLQYYKFRDDYKSPLIAVLREIAVDTVYAIILFGIAVTVYSMVSNRSIESIFIWLKG
jgi:hypothetical protein